MNHANILFFEGKCPDLSVTELGYSAPDTERVIPFNVRSTWLLHIVLRGVCRFCDFDAPADSAFLIARNRLHGFSVAPGYEHYWFAFDGALAEELLRRRSLPTDRHILFRQAFPGETKRILQTTFRDCRAREDGEPLAVAALLAVLALLTPQGLPEAGDGTGRSIPDSLSAAARFLRRHHARRLTMTEVAAYVHMSEKNLCRQFRRYFGEAPSRYLLSVRMARARELLGGTSLRIREVAQSVGYPSQLAFSGVFRRETGMSPTAYRSRSDRLSKKTTV